MDAMTDVRRLVADEAIADGDSPDVLGTLQRLCRAAARALPAAGAGVSVMSHHGAPVRAAASDSTSVLVEELQFVVGEGPCLEAYSSESPVLVPDLMDSGRARWPGYAPAAHQLGVKAVFAFALQVGAARLGVLVVYRRQAGQLSARELSQALTFADVAMEMLLDAQEQITAGAAPALAADRGTGFELYQAQGMVMVMLSVSLEEAMSRIRARAFAENRRLTDVARDIVKRMVVLEVDRPDDGTRSDTW